ncbi:MAG: type II toxin-antitoxin system RelE/ParE family toxin [Acidithiobacillus sp.]|jgi:mRNA interferase RelE/StbE|uniref:Type II toxin-antitoxin system RelE/ParE family toxin n=1 Tax=Acidithiobacillus ferruginosus TaxID=3063951 RepID=A0ACD5IFX6_9PROT|nr:MULTISPECIES: type II toxin-antitoxin system RelE/ParE family toxin [Acidithiobacillus]MBU2814813.1 type II toxin-antitoxin system RelE/ParE family toxin [Acidithiobacillus ferruginosus]MCK9189776.1 type II toxin-antitoxin system RelE/ParE family toxin [Acidithiobacillus sp.]MCK9358239.1 type II toxin-antitoxin system RelE/ParE family toxin [Acidithiobacillus sp.]MDD5002984.1 type II toxin-antitoxin system RelE/ParE family toxin [Acidithiobacillus sp.]MDD5377793.1 type II toxin-antitoxin sy
MPYELTFHPSALKEWQALDHSVRAPFKKKLAERLVHPRVPSAQLQGHPDRYKIKLRSIGYRLIYQVMETEVQVLVLAVGKREGSVAYHKAKGR